MDVILWKDDEGRVIAYTPPAGMTAQEAQEYGEGVPHDRPTFVIDNATLPAAPLAAWRLSAEGSVTVDQAAADALATPPLPTKSELQARLDVLAAEIAALGK